MSQNYPLLKLAVMMTLGMTAGHWLSAYLPSEACLVAFLFLFVLTIVSRRWGALQSILLLLTFAMLGCTLMVNAERKMQITLPEKEIVYNAVVASEPQVHGKVLMMDLIVVGKGQPVKIRASILCDTIKKRYLSLHIGDGIRACSHMDRPKNYPGSTFDYATWLLRHDFKAQTFIFYDSWQKAVVDLRSLSIVERTTLLFKIYRHKLLTRLKVADDDGPGYPLIAAMVLGEKGGLSKQTRLDFSISGASHVLALSGLHMGIIYTLITLLTYRWRRSWLGQFLAILALWAFAFLVGLPTSAVRSAIMLSVYAFTIISYRFNTPLNTLAFVAMVMLMIHPLDLFDIGFQMSFMAVLSISLILPLFHSKEIDKKLIKHRIRKWLYELMAVSVSAQVGTAPLVAYYFHRFSTYFLLSNIIVIPLITIILYGTLLALFLSFFPLLYSLIAKIVVLLATIMNSGVAFVASLPGSSIENINWSLPQLFMVYIICSCLYLILYRLINKYRTWHL